MCADVRIGFVPTFYNTAHLLIADPETPNRLGTDLDWKAYGNCGAIAEALKAGELDIAYTDITTTALAISQGVKLKCMAGGHMEGSVLFGNSALAGNATLTDIAAALGQLNSKTVGVTGYATTQHVTLLKFIKDQGLQITVKADYAKSKALLDAIASGEVAAAIGTPDQAIGAVRAGGKILCPPGLVWPQNPSYGIVVHPSYMPAGLPFMMKFLVLHLKAAELMRTMPSAVAKIISKNHDGIEEKFVLDVLALSPRYCIMISDEFLKSSMELVAAMHGLDLIPAALSQADIFDLNLISKIHPKKDHYGFGSA